MDTSMINERFLIKFQILDFFKKLEGIGHTGPKTTSLDKAGFFSLPQTPPFPTAFPNQNCLVVCWDAEGPTLATPILILSQTFSPQ